MSKYCQTCGAAVEEETVFCSQCGARLTADAQTQPNAGETAQVQPAAEAQQDTPAKKNARKPLIIALITVACIFIVGVVAVFSLIAGSLFGTGYEQPVKNMFNGMQKADYDLFMSAFTPEKQAQINEQRKDDNMTKREFMDTFVLELEDLEETYGKNVKIEYKVLDKELVDSAALNEMTSTYDLSYTPTEAYNLYLEVSIGGTEFKKEERLSLTVINMRGSWYMLYYPSMFQ